MTQKWTNDNWDMISKFLWCDGIDIHSHVMLECQYYDTELKQAHDANNAWNMPVFKHMKNARSFEANNA